MASSMPFDALKRMKLKIEQDKIELAELKDKLQATTDRCAAVAKANAEMEAEVVRSTQRIELTQARRAARAAEMAKMRQYLHNEQLPRLEVLRERLSRRLEMREKQQELFEKQDVALANAVQQQQDYQNSLPKIARRNELQEQYAELVEQLRVKTEELEAKKALLAERRKKNKETWDWFVKICIKAAENWKERQEAEQLTKLEEEKRFQEILAKSKVNVVKPTWLPENFGRDELSLSTPKKLGSSDEFSKMVSMLLSKSTPEAAKPQKQKFQDLWEDFNKKLALDIRPPKLPSPAKRSRPSYLVFLDDLKSPKNVSNVVYSPRKAPSKCLEFSTKFQQDPEHEPSSVTPEASNNLNSENQIELAECTPIGEKNVSIEIDSENQNQLELCEETSGGFEPPLEVPAVEMLSPKRPLNASGKNTSPIRSLIASVDCTDTEDISPCDLFKAPQPVFMEQTSSRRQDDSPARSVRTFDLSQSDVSFSSQRSSASDSPRMSRFALSTNGHSTPGSSSSFATPRFESSQSSRYNFFGSTEVMPVNDSSTPGMKGFELNFGDESSDNSVFNLNLDQETFNFDEDKDGAGAFF